MARRRDPWIGRFRTKPLPKGMTPAGVFRELAAVHVTMRTVLARRDDWSDFTRQAEATIAESVQRAIHRAQARNTDRAPDIDDDPSAKVET